MVEEVAPGSQAGGLRRGFRTFCEVIAAKPEATVLAYREGKTLSLSGRDQMKAEDAAAIVTMNRPERYNAFRAKTVEEMIKAFRLAWADH